MILDILRMVIVVKERLIDYVPEVFHIMYRESDLLMFLRIMEEA